MACDYEYHLSQIEVSQSSDSAPSECTPHMSRCILGGEGVRSSPLFQLTIQINFFIKD